MLRLRNELHFREGKSQDVLDRPTQMEIAESWGYHGTEGVLPVEQFMQDYFDNTRNVRYAAAYFADDARSPRFRDESSSGCFRGMSMMIFGWDRNTSGSARRSSNALPAAYPTCCG